MEQSRLDALKRAFRPIPDRDAYYPATVHEQVLAKTLGALRDEEGMALVVGEPGLGKTLLGYCLLERLGTDVASAFLLNPHFHEPASLLQALCYEFEIPYEKRSEEELRLAFTDHLLKSYGAGRRTVLVIDEAQHLGPAALEELRLLGNLEGKEGKAVQVVLLALPAFMQTLEAAELDALRQRLTACAELRPLDVHEAGDYLLHRARLAGIRPEEAFGEETVGILARAAGGVPRLLNRAVYQAAALAAANGLDQVDAEVALEAVGELRLGEDDRAGAEEHVFAAPRRPA